MCVLLVYEAAYADLLYPDPAGQASESYVRNAGTAFHGQYFVSAAAREPQHWQHSCTIVTLN